MTRRHDDRDCGNPMDDPAHDLDGTARCERCVSWAADDEGAA